MILVQRVARTVGDAEARLRRMLSRFFFEKLASCCPEEFALIDATAACGGQDAVRARNRAYLLLERVAGGECAYTRFWTRRVLQKRFGLKCYDDPLFPAAVHIWNFWATIRFASVPSRWQAWKPEAVQELVGLKPLLDVCHTWLDTVRALFCECVVGLQPGWPPAIVQLLKALDLIGKAM